MSRSMTNAHAHARARAHTHTHTHTHTSKHSHQIFPSQKVTVNKRAMKLQFNSIHSTVAAQIEEFLSSLVRQIKYRTNKS